MNRISGEAKKAKEKTNSEPGKDTSSNNTPITAKMPDLAEKVKALPVNIWYVGLAFAVIISFYLRAIVPWGSVFVGDKVVFSSESDAWYHMMLAKSTVLNLHRTFYDPLTNFPNGTSIHFGPFQDWAIALISLVLGLGHPSMHTVDVVGAFWPVIMGILLIFPVYFIGKEIGGKSCGLMAALLIALLPGQLFSRTTLGFSDHHSSEALLSTTAVLFFMLAARSGRDLSLESIKKMDMTRLKTPLIYTLLAGLFLGLYIDAWSMGILFEGILLIFIVLQSIADHMRGRPAEVTGLMGGLTFFIAFLLVLPFANSANGFSMIQYSLFHPVSLLFGAIFVVAIALASKMLADRNANKLTFVGAIVGVPLALMALLYIAVPKYMQTLINGLQVYLFPRTGGAATVAELSSLITQGSAGIQENFPGINGLLSPFFFALIGIALLIYVYIRGWRPEELLVAVWSLVILAITVDANRSAYYYTINIAVLCAYLTIKVMDLAGSGLKSALSRSGEDTNVLEGNLNVRQLAVLAVAAFLFIYPSVSISYQTAKYATGGPQSDWYSSTQWLQTNTPNPGLDIYNIYQRPPDTQLYQYPNTAYGIMSWWDYGHLIETIGHRYPNANPFQEGIGSITRGVPGSSPFFLAENETAAEKVATDLDTSRSPYSNIRYVMTDYEMAIGKFYAMTAWSSVPVSRYEAAVYQPQGDQLVPIQIFRPPYFDSMVTRLQFFDGSESPIDSAVGISYRAVELSDGNKYPVMTQAPLITNNYTALQNFVKESKASGDNADIISSSPANTPVPLEALKHYRLVHESETAVTNSGQKYVKTFEHVPGATITGKAPAGTSVSISVPILTNHNRNFVYTQSATTDASGKYTLVVPYSTEGPSESGTKFDTAPIGPYELSVPGSSPVSVRVPESAVMNGGTISL